MNREQIIPSHTDVLSMAREAGGALSCIAEPLEHPWKFSESELIRFAALVSKQERWRGFNQGYKQAIKDCVALLMIQHEAAKRQHNYWHVAANLIEAEYGVHSDD